MTVTQARFLLGRSGRGLTEAEILDRIAKARELADLLFRSLGPSAKLVIQ